MIFFQKNFALDRRAWLLIAHLVCAVLLLSVPTRAQFDLTSLFEKGRAAEKSGDFTAAEHAYQQVLQLEPGNAEALKRLGVVEQTELKFNESIVHFQAILSRDAKHPETNFFLGVSYLGLGDFPRAIQSFENELATPKPHPRCRYYLGLAYESSNRMDQAISEFRRSASENSKDADSLYQLARIYKNASVQMVDQLRALDPDSYQLHLLLGELNADDERYAEAITEYQAALAKRPNATGIHYAIGVAHWVQHQIGPAKKEFVEALKENPNDPLTNLYLGDIAVRNREYTDGLMYLRHAEKGAADMFQVHLLLGKCYRGQNELELARNEFDAAIKVDPAVPETHFLLAQVYQQLKDSQASEKEFAEFQRLSELEKGKASQNGPQN